MYAHQEHQQTLTLVTLQINMHRKVAFPMVSHRGRESVAVFLTIDNVTPQVEDVKTAASSDFVRVRWVPLQMLVCQMVFYSVQKRGKRVGSMDILNSLLLCCGWAA